MERKDLSALDALQWSKLPPHVDYIAFVDFVQDEQYRVFDACKWTLYDPNIDVVISQDKNDPREESYLNHFFKLGRKCVIATVDWADFMFLKKLLWDMHEVVFFGKERSKGGVQLGWMLLRDEFYPYCLQFREHQVVELSSSDRKKPCFHFNDIVSNMSLKPDPFSVMAQEGDEHVEKLDTFLRFELPKRLEGPWVTVEKCDFHYLVEFERELWFEKRDREVGCYLPGREPTGIKVVYGGFQFPKDEVINAFKVKRQLNSK